jgi:hypothetical protein
MPGSKFHRRGPGARASGLWTRARAMRDLGQVFEHEGPLPHPNKDQPQ